jgi:uncharacterized protein
MSQFIRTVWTADMILSHLSTYYETLKSMGVTRLGLFGSYARGEQQPDSDLDFLVSIEPMSYSAWMDVWNFLEDTFGLTVDLVPEEALRPEFKTRVMSEVRHVEGL